LVGVEAREVSKIFKTTKALDNVSLSVDDGSFFCLLGPSGSGKTTLMRIIAGLETPTSGRVYFGGEDVTDLSPSERNIAMVFQFPSIYPSLNIYENIALTLRRETSDRNEIRERVMQVASLLKIEEHLNKKSHQIDFGILQRVSIAKAIVRKANVYIFDEPLSNLDTKLREALRSEFQRIHSEVRGTFLYVTHDQLEAMAIADKIGILNNGKLLQVGSPEEIYSLPANKFVAYFIGSPTINLIESEVKLVESNVYASIGEGHVHLNNKALKLFQTSREPKKLILGIRPHDIALSREPVENALPAEVSFIESLGTAQVIELKNGHAVFRCYVDGLSDFKEKEKVYAVFNIESIHGFDPQTEERVF
jgi:multiple sugar transport system ATP-binding protein